MNTTEDFKNAPVGATATSGGGVRAMKMVHDGEQRWITRGGNHVDDELMEFWGYTLDLPTTAREALDIAWELAHEVKPGQSIPKGARYLEVTSFGLKEYTAMIDFEVSPENSALRTVDLLPEPKPDWLERPLPSREEIATAIAEGWNSVTTLSATAQSIGPSAAADAVLDLLKGQGR